MKLSSDVSFHQSQHFLKVL